MTTNEAKKKAMKIQDEIRQEVKREKGMDNKQIVAESLEEFKEMNEMDAFSDVLGEMMAR